MQHLIYLHGFLSSPQSEKAQQTLGYVKANYPALNLHIPQLSGNIVRAVASVEYLIASLPTSSLRFIGSSMGGFLSTYFVEKYGNKMPCKAVIVNPAVAPYNLMQDYQGQHINPYSLEHFSVNPYTINHLHRFDSVKIADPSCYKVLLQTGDETLDYRLAEAKYQGADVTIEQGGNHSFVGYQKHLPAIFNFLR